MITFDDTQLRQYESDLKTFAARSYPFAARFAIWKYAWTGRLESHKIVKKEMILRNKHTLNTIIFWPKSANKMSLNPRNMMSIFGSTEKYMEVQEFGGVKKKKGRIGTTIPTSESAGQKEQIPRTRKVTKKNRLSLIKLKKKNKKKSANKKQHNIIAIREAKKEKRKFVYLETHKNKGIFSVRGTKKKPKIRMLYNLSHKQVTIPKTPWMQPAVKETEKLRPQIYFDALENQLKRLKTYNL